MMTIEKGNSLQPARVDISSLEHRMIHIAHTRIDIRTRIEFQKVRYHELSSAEVDEPVADDGDFWIFDHCSGFYLFLCIFPVFSYSLLRFRIFGIDYLHVRR